MKSGAVYLDNAATTPVDLDVVEAMLPYLREHFGNASSVHAFGRRAKDALEEARTHVASLLDADPAEIVFTSGGTEADTFAMLLLAHASDRRGVRRIVSSAAEHHAVLAMLERLEHDGFAVVHAPVTPHGAARLNEVLARLDEGAGGVALLHVNNETGGITDVGTIAEAAHARGIFMHVDAVQSAGKLPLSSADIPFDTAAMSAHKIHGPKGIGALFIRKGTEIEPLFPGGSQERGRRGGTENVALAVGFGAAAVKAMREREARHARWEALRADLLARLRAVFPHVVLNGGGAASMPNIVSLSFPAAQYPLDGELLVVTMDLEGVAVSSGSACTSGSVTASHVMRAIGHDDATGAATVRVSFGATTDSADVERGADALIRVVQRLTQAVSARDASRNAMP